ncbi:MAG TPA: alpha/beta hydrolase-fold protein, partial [Anaerolineales bacterium]|nr:alpha/beta hydrolase-fold protein [Anaerolineales bacterium]
VAERLGSTVLAVLLAACAAPAPLSTSSPTAPMLLTPTAIAAPSETPMPTETPAGTLEEHAYESALLGRAQRYAVYLPAGYAETTVTYPLAILLQTVLTMGVGLIVAPLVVFFRDLDRATKLVLRFLFYASPIIYGLGDLRAGYYVDSAYTGGDAPGAALETAFFVELMPHIEASYRVHADRAGRLIGGYSMGGFGALRYALAYPEVFGAALVLSPAVYTPLPPADSSTREFGAFGRGEMLFVDAIYERLNYPALVNDFATSGLTLRLFIAVGDDEYKNPDPADALHDIDLEAHLVFNRLVRVPNISAEFRVLDGGHGWDVWTPAFVAGARYLGPTLKPPE